MSPRKIALLRGINVGGTGKLPMADLRSLISGLGAANVQTYIQSGNVAFRGDVDADMISNGIEAKFGFRPRCMVLDGDALRKAAAANPFVFAKASDMHLFFCGSRPEVDPAILTGIANGVEEWHLADRVFYLHSPGGLSKSKLAAKLERRMGVAMTARNWNTVSKLLDMLDGEG